MIIVCRFFSKYFVPMSQFTDAEKNLLSRVFLNDYMAQHFKWKRYKVNEHIDLADQDVAIISWDNFYKGHGTLQEARNQAKLEKLDLVLVCKNPATVRIMNYKNWILRWAFRDSQIKAVNFSKRSSPIYYISHRINDSDLELKLKRISELLEKHESIVIESKVSEENSFEEVGNLRKFEAKIQKLIRGFMMGKVIDLKVISNEFSCKIIVKKVGTSNSSINMDMALNEPNDERLVVEKKLDKDFGNDEDEYMNMILSGEHSKFDVVKEENEMKREMSEDEQMEELFEEKEEQSDPANKEMTDIRQRVVDLVGVELADKFLKGRLKFK